MKALIDGDMLAFRACRSVETEERFGEWDHVLSSNYEEASLKADRLLDDVLEYVNTNDYLLYFSCSASDNWRRAVLPGYKDNRKGIRKPLCMKRMVDDYMAIGRGRREPHMEADDLMGIACKGSTIIVSGDKDFRSVPGFFMRLTADWGMGPVEHQSVVIARFNHMVQAVAGDRTDGYNGCPRYGVIKAARLINGVTQSEGKIEDGEIDKVWNLILHTYVEEGLGEDHALKNAQVSYILNIDGEGPGTRWDPSFYSEVYCG